jgi:hypothetical protein
MDYNRIWVKPERLKRSKDPTGYQILGERREEFQLRNLSLTHAELEAA